MSEEVIISCEPELISSGLKDQTTELKSTTKKDFIKN
jgi:hypothetical protein